MGEAPEIQLRVLSEDEKLNEDSVEQQTNGNQSTTITQQRTYKWWLLMTIYTFFLLSGQSVATLLGRLYYDKGGNSKWLATIVQVVGFPILIPLYYLPSYKSSHTSNITANPPSLLVLSGMYFGLGLLLAAGCLLYSVGLLYLPVSTYSLICASQLAFNALFSFFFNSQKFTPFIINSLVLLTISSTLLVFQNDSSGSTQVPRAKYVIGFVCTVAASAGVGLFASGEWKSLGEEMEGFKLGKSAYVNVLVWIAVGWQVFSIGAVGLIFEASSLFSNVISTLGLPIVPVFAMVFFHDPMTGIKVISMLLAIWGFVSYVYQHYLDDRNSDTGKL
ncbi:hypothetical protein E1A91_D06G167300v1 [Gossypium mustelinum]|uniref:Probable purine permease n=1 Tax=Gossypium mustelinum TaxID=34275 RepID=A0A5D2UM42_GOSMU|nr:hypothetical protein E1A91_D06G167300v1 [Gossypium mustelinum]